jgi:DNA polymerase-3 subunit alpha
VDTQKVNKKVLEALIKSGSLDCFDYSRRALFDQVEHIIEAAHKSTQAKKMAEHSLFGENEEMTRIVIDIQRLEEYGLKHILVLEKESIGFYISGHPLDDFKAEMEGLNYTLSSAFDDIEDGSQAMVIGKVEEVTTKFSKKGNRFGIVSLMDLHGNLEITLFEKDLIKLESMNLDEPLAFKVAVNRDDQFVRIRSLKMMPLKDVSKEKVQTKMRELPAEPMAITLNVEGSTERLEAVYQLVQAHPGRRPLTITLTSKLQDVVIETHLSVDDAFMESFQSLSAKDEDVA